MENYTLYKIQQSKKFFIISIIILPILFLYATPIPGFTIGDLILIINTMFLVFKKKLKKNTPLLIFVIFLIIQTSILGSIGSLPKITTSIRYIVYLLIMSIMPTVAEERDYIIKILSKVGKFVVVFLLVQYAALQVGILIPGLITFLPLTADDGLSYSEIFSIGGRVMSVFAEPSHYAIYALLFLAVNLFEYPEITLKNLKWQALTSISLIACSSFSGVMCMVAVWALKLLLLIKNKQLSIKAIFPILIILLLFGFVILHTTMGTYVSDAEIYERQSAGRFGGFTYVLEQSSNLFILLFGNGMNDIAEVEYLSGWPRVYFYYGIIGSLIYLMAFLQIFKKNTISMVLMILIAVLMIGTEMNFAPFIMPYILLVFATNNYSLKLSR